MTRLDRDSVLLSVGELVRREVDLDAVLTRAIDVVTRAVGAERGTLFLLDRQRRELFSKVGHLPELEEIRIKLGQGIAGHVADSGVAANLADASIDRRFYPGVDQRTGFATKSVLCVPVKDRIGEILGAIELLNRKTAPFDEADEALVRTLASQVAMVIESTSLYARLRTPSKAAVHYRYNGIVGESEAMDKVLDVVAKAADTDATVLLTGATGTGKGLIARAVHFNSPRRHRPFVHVDCAALPATLIESELFGHERGAFTGADRRVVGRFEAADGGTVFLDEIGELPLPLQGRLLRVLQDRAFERIGGRKTIAVDVRIVAATNRVLEDLVARREFREDLYYRLRVVTARLPSLVERGPDEVELLAHHFLALHARRHGREVTGFSEQAIAQLRAHKWPGNVRELENCIESATVLARGETIEVDELPLPSSRVPPASDLGTLTWHEMERRYIEAAVRHHGGNRSATARAMGIGRSTLLRKLREYGVEVD